MATWAEVVWPISAVFVAVVCYMFGHARGIIKGHKDESAHIYKSAPKGPKPV